MQRLTVGSWTGLAGLAVLAMGTPAGAMMIAPAPIANRVALAECVVVGKVTAIEDQPVAARPFPGAKDKVAYLVAVVKVTDAIRGAKGEKEIRVGFMPPKAPVGGGIRPILRRYPQVNLKVDQEACLLLTRHPDGKFYVAPAFYSVIDKKTDPNFNKDVAMVKRCARLLDDPMIGLKARDAKDRLLTAAMLVARYRTPSPVANGGLPRTEPVGGRESKLILETLADADWSKNDADLRMGPQGVFFQLGLTPKEGWTPPANFKDLPEAARQWLKDNAGTYRIQRFVPARADKK